MRADDLDRHMRSVGTWVDWATTVDTFKHGDPTAEVKGIAVAWMSLRSALEEAAAADCNLFVTHEPTFYAHRDDDPTVFRYAHARDKRDFLDRTDTVVYRCHDTWDVMPEIGVLDTWRKGLALGGEVVAAAKYYAVVERPSVSVRALASHVLGRVRCVGQDSVQVVGDLNRRITRVGIGTGAITDVVRLADLGAEAAIVTDDGLRLWQGGAWAIDAGIPLIVVDHATAEEWAMRSLASYIAEQFPGVPVRHIQQGCLYRTIT
jgi:putative NIF3 family GTP cyclohydrolase 1 type 2